VVNVARGGIINESDLVDALNGGQVGGAAVDVFMEEPPTFRPLVDHPKCICTPHLGASTMEAQQRVAVEIAENILELNAGKGLFGALNAPALAAVLDESKAQFVKAVSDIGRIIASISPNAKTVTVHYPVGAKGLQKALIAGAVVGLLHSSHGKSGSQLNLINAERNAVKAGITVRSEPVSKGNEIILTAEGASVTGYPSPAGTVISAINGAKVPVAIVATGCLAIRAKGNNDGLSEQLQSKLSVSYGLIGGGRLAVFNREDLSEKEMADISKAFNAVVQFD